MRLWDAANGHAIARLTGHTGPVLSAALSPDGKLAASGGADRAIRLWNVERKQTATTLTGHGGPVVALAFSPDGHFLVSSGRSLRGGEWRHESSGSTPNTLVADAAGSGVAGLRAVGS